VPPIIDGGHRRPERAAGQVVERLRDGERDYTDWSSVAACARIGGLRVVMALILPSRVVIGRR
jgi:hypothetical protein